MRQRKTEKVREGGKEEEGERGRRRRERGRRKRERGRRRKKRERKRKTQNIFILDLLQTLKKPMSGHTREDIEQPPSRPIELQCVSGSFRPEGVSIYE